MSAAKSGWEARGTCLLPLKQTTATPTANKTSRTSHTIGAAKTQAATPAAAGRSVAQRPSTAAAAAAAASQIRDPKHEFHRHLPVDLDFSPQRAPLSASASLCALGGAVHGSSAHAHAHGHGHTLGRSSSSSSTSFAPPPVSRHALAAGPMIVAEDERLAEDDDADSDGDDGLGRDHGNDDTFMTATQLSPRGLAARARGPAPLCTSSTSIVPASSAAMSASALARHCPAPTSGYFTCPKCRLGLEAAAAVSATGSASVHATLVADLLGEHDRMSAFVKQHERSFADRMKWNSSAKERKQQQLASVAGAAASAAELDPYMDLTFLSDSSVPPALSFVFPSLTPGEFAVLRHDDTFLCSTIDCCSDCHELVSAPVQPGTGQEKTLREPLSLDAYSGDGSGATVFHNPNSEAQVTGLSHASMLERQARRALDESVESREFAASESALLSLRARRRALGEVDPTAAAAGLVPPEVRRLNQATLDMLKHIGPNALELQERKQLQEAQQARHNLLKADNDTQKKQRGDAVKAILNKYAKTTKGGEGGGGAKKRAAASDVQAEHGNDEEDGGDSARSDPNAGSASSGQPRGAVVQHHLLLQLGLAPAPFVAPPRPLHEAALDYTHNPFMRPRGSAPAAKTLRPSSSSAAAASGSAAAPIFPTHADVRAHRLAAAAEKEEEERDGVSGYPVFAASSSSSLATSGSQRALHNAGLVQSERRRLVTETVVDDIIARAAELRLQAAEVKRSEQRNGALSPPRRSTRHQPAAASSPAFGPLYAQLTRRR